MATPAIRGEWDVNWNTVPASIDFPHCLTEMIDATSPSIIGTSVTVDDFSARHDRDGSVCSQGILQFIPYGPSDIVSSLTNDGDIAVYMTAKPPVFNTNRDGLFAELKQRGFHAELCYKHNPQTWNASVWGDGFKDRAISSLNSNDILNTFLNIYRLVLPSGPVANSPAFSQSIRSWKLIYDKYATPPGDYRWYLDPADFSSRTDLAKTAIALLNRQPGTDPNLPPVTCVQWVYTVFCLALLFPLSEQILKELRMLDSYTANWQMQCGNPINQVSPFLPDVPFKPYSPAQMMQAFLDTYCGGVDLMFLLRSGGSPIQTKILQYIQSACPDYSSFIQPYLQQLVATGDPTLQLNEAPHGFIMPSCFFCEERKPRQAGSSCWFEYIGTAMPQSFLKKQS